MHLLLRANVAVSMSKA